MLSIFEKRTPRTIVFFAFYTLFIKLILLFSYEGVENNSTHLLKYLIPNNKIMSILDFALGISIIFIGAVLFNSLINNMRALGRKNYFQAVNLILFTSLSVSLNTITTPFILLIISLIIVQLVISIVSIGINNQKIFLLGLCTGLLAFFSLTTLILVPFIIGAILISKVISLKNIVLFLIAVCAPFYWVGTLAYLSGNFLAFGKVFEFSKIQFFNYDTLIGDKIVWVVLVVYTIFLMIYIFRIFNSISFGQRNFLRSIMFYLGACYFLFLSGSTSSNYLLALIVVPTSVLSGYVMLTIPKKVLMEVIHVIFVLIIIGINFFR